MYGSPHVYGWMEDGMRGETWGVFWVPCSDFFSMRKSLFPYLLVHRKGAIFARLAHCLPLALRQPCTQEASCVSVPSVELADTISRITLFSVCPLEKVAFLQVWVKVAVLFASWTHTPVLWVHSYVRQKSLVLSAVSWQACVLPPALCAFIGNIQTCHAATS